MRQFNGGLIMSKTIMLEKHEIVVEGAKSGVKPIQLNESDLVFAASRFKQDKGQQNVGYSWAEFKKFKRIDDALVKAELDGKLVLDDSDFDTLFENLKKTEWNNASKETVDIIIRIVEKFETAKGVKE